MSFLKKACSELKIHVECLQIAAVKNLIQNLDGEGDCVISERCGNIFPRNEVYKIAIFARFPN